MPCPRRMCFQIPATGWKGLYLLKKAKEGGTEVPKSARALGPEM